MTKRETVLAFLKAHRSNARLDNAEVAEQTKTNERHVGRVRAEFDASRRHLRRVASRLAD